ncbi:MAG: hypothetical protein ACUVTR_01890 [Dehalococcoidia bacterium]
MMVREFIMAMPAGIAQNINEKEMIWNAINVEEGEVPPPGGGEGPPPSTMPWQWIGLGLGAVIGLVIATRKKREPKIGG